MSNSKNTKQASSAELFISFSTPKIPEELIRLATMIGQIKYPVGDMQDFIEKLKAVKSTSKTTTDAAYKHFLVRIFSANDLPILTMRNAVEKFHLKIQRMKSIAGSQKGNCSCNENLPNTARFDNPFDDYYITLQKWQDCVDEHPGNMPWANFCSCIYAFGVTDWEAYGCLVALLKQLTDNTR